MRALTLLFIITFAAISATAASGGHHEGVPKAVYWHAFNLALMIAGLVYFAGAGIKNMFAERKTVYLASANRARELREQAERENREIKMRLEKISITASDSISRAEADAINMKTLALKEAQEVAARIRTEAGKSAVAERERARRDLKESVIIEATDLAKQKLQKNLTTEDHKSLLSDFVSKAQAAKL